MDISLYLRVLWRFRVVVLLGIVVGALLALVSISRVTFDGVKPELAPRQDEVWRSASTLFVTQDGFPWGRTIFDESIKVDGVDGAQPTFIPRFADPGRLSGLAVLYTELAKSDEVRRAFLRKAPLGARYEPTVVKSSDGGSVLPLIYITGYGKTPQMAQYSANLATASFRQYLGTKQAAARIPDDKRVEVVVTNRATTAELFEPRSVVRPVFLFLLVLMSTIALVFVLENLRPSGRRAPSEVLPVQLPAEKQPAAPTQRSA